MHGAVVARRRFRHDNVDFGDWTSYLGDPPLVMALT